MESAKLTSPALMVSFLRPELKYILGLLVDGYRRKALMERLCVSRHTVERELTRMYDFLGIGGITAGYKREAAIEAYREWMDFVEKYKAKEPEGDPVVFTSCGDAGRLQVAGVSHRCREFRGGHP